jgi:hypothetical protein
MQLRELEYIIDQLADFYEPDEARQWICAPQKLLGGASPAELIRSGRVGVMSFSLEGRGVVGNRIFSWGTSREMSPLMARHGAEFCCVTRILNLKS